MKNTLRLLTEIFNDAQEFEAKYVAVSVKLPNVEEPEIIINKNSSISAKLKYYQDTYNENLEHKHTEGIKILDFTYAESLKEIESYFFWTK